jgi:hypothetical protein
MNHKDEQVTELPRSVTHAKRCAFCDGPFGASRFLVSPFGAGTGPTFCSTICVGQYKRGDVPDFAQPHAVGALKAGSR